MPSAAAIRLQVESAIQRRIPSALTPIARTVRPFIATGIEALDDLLGGGIPVGAVTELVGAECTGRTSIATALVAQTTRTGRVCAWVDASNAFDPLSASACGVLLERLLWVRCALLQQTTPPARPTVAAPVTAAVARQDRKGLHGCGFGPHPRAEARGMSEAMTSLFAPQPAPVAQLHTPAATVAAAPPTAPQQRTSRRAKHYDAIEYALRTTDLLLGTGGFSVLVLDLASMAPEHVARIELSTWHRYRVAAEKQQAALLLMTQHPCAKSGSELQLRMTAADPVCNLPTVFEGMQPRVEIHRQRFAAPASNVIPMRKGPQHETDAHWHSRTAWAGAR